jgi:pSer/pThr/pTyr-binding forkhead associated (FHA) protein
MYNLLDLEKKFDDELKKPNNKKEKEGDINIFNQKKNQNDYNYIIFDTITPDKKDDKYRYLVKFEKNNIMKIGRALEMQLILNDISVSRNHCQLKLEEDGEIFLEDNNSKFGSLILIQAETIEILKGNTLTIQIGTNFLNFELKKKKNLFGCCDVEEIDIKNSYEKINYKAIKYDKINEILNESITPVNSDNEEEEKEKEKNIDNKNKELIDKEDENKNIINNNIDSVNFGNILVNENNINKENKNGNNENDIKNKDI